MRRPGEKPGLNALLDRCVAYHGHLCMGQVLGLRVAVKGLALAAPKTPRDLIVAVENDRCVADAIQTVTGMRLGKRTLKFFNYGRMAATFLNCSTGKAFRVCVNFGHEKKVETEAEMRKVLELPDEKVVAWQAVRYIVPENEQPGLPKRVIVCSVCGEKVFDGKDLPGRKGPMCIACKKGAYYEVLR